MSHSLDHSLGVGRFSGWGTIDAIGIAEGIMLFWYKRILELIDMVNGVFSISCLFRNVEDGFHWIFTCVSGPVVCNLRENLW